MRAYEAQARAAWERAAARSGLAMDEHGYKLDRTYGAVADYIAKFGREPLKPPWGVEAEVTKGHLKQGRGRKDEHVTPFGLLSLIYQGNEELIPVFQAYARGELLEVARSGDWEHVQTFLTEIGCSLATGDGVA